MKLILFLILFPFIEILTFIEVGQEIGALYTISITILSAIIGLYLVKQQAYKEQLEILQKVSSGENLILETISSLLLFIAGILLLLPGLIGDAFGFILIFPFIRKNLTKIFFKTKNTKTNTRVFIKSNDDIIDIKKDDEF